MTEKEEIQNEYIEEQAELVYMVFQYDIDSFYVGTVDKNQLNDGGEYAFNILYPLAIELVQGMYVFSELNQLGDNSFNLNLNKSKVIAMFSPNDNVTGQYEKIINNKFHNIPHLEEIVQENTVGGVNFYEVNTIQ